MIRGLVLAGGKSSRFGSDKALALYEGVSFLERAVSLLKTLHLKPIVVTRRGAGHFLVDCTVVYDKLPDLGPLGGLYTAMTVFRNTAFLVLTCDMPALDPKVLQRLLDEREPSRDLVFYSSSERPEQPFPGIYEPSVLQAVRDKLKQNDLSMMGLFKRVASKKTVDWKGDPDVFCNINTAEDLRSRAKGRSKASNESGDFRVR